MRYQKDMEKCVFWPDPLCPLSKYTHLMFAHAPAVDWQVTGSLKCSQYLLRCLPLL